MGHAELQPQPKSLSELQAGLASGRMMEGGGGGVCANTFDVWLARQNLREEAI